MSKKKQKKENQTNQNKEMTPIELCELELIKVLEKYNCKLDASFTMSVKGMFPMIKVVQNGQA